MYIIPAIDLLDGQCVRLYKGNYEQSTEYSMSPKEQAHFFAEQGAKRLHVVDLDAAKGQGKHNRDAIAQICQVFPGLVEVGGGVRTEEDVKELLKLGVDRLIVGTALATNPQEVRKWIHSYGDIFIGGIDALDGKIKIAGWQESNPLKDVELAVIAKRIGIVSIIYTNISRDGTLEGPDIQSTVKIADKGGIPVIHSGGISCSEDIKALKDLKHPLITGIITGKALYENKLDLKSCIDSYQVVNGAMPW